MPMTNAELAYTKVFDNAIPASAKYGVINRLKTRLQAKLIVHAMNTQRVCINAAENLDRTRPTK